LKGASPEELLDVPEKDEEQKEEELPEPKPEAIQAISDQKDTKEVVRVEVDQSAIDDVKKKFEE
jgi:hypothetical protein